MAVQGVRKCSQCPVVVEAHKLINRLPYKHTLPVADLKAAVKAVKP